MGSSRISARHAELRAPVAMETSVGGCLMAILHDTRQFTWKRSLTRD